MSIKEAAEHVLQQRKQMQELEQQLREAKSDYYKAVGDYLKATEDEGPVMVVGSTLIRRKTNGYVGYDQALSFETVNVL